MKGLLTHRGALFLRRGRFGRLVPATLAAILVLVLLAPGKATQAQIQSANWHTNGGGVEAAVFWYTPDGQGTLQLGQLDGAPFLYYDIQNFTTGYYECGFGNIPAADLTGTPEHTLTLNTDTSATANPQFIRCGSGGAISVTIDRTSWSTLRSSGQRETEYDNGSGGRLLVHESGQGFSTSATAQGTILGTALPAQTGAVMGNYRQVFISIDLIR